jgi:hypothetical protein
MKSHHPTDSGIEWSQYRNNETGESFRLVDGELLVCPADYPTRPIQPLSSLTPSPTKRREYEVVKRRLERRVTKHAQ